MFIVSSMNNSSTPAGSNVTHDEFSNSNAVFRFHTVCGGPGYDRSRRWRSNSSCFVTTVEIENLFHKKLKM